jgi:hypothetical protein
MQNKNLQICGVAHSFHNSVDHCVVIVFADHAREDTKKLMKLMNADA